MRDKELLFFSFFCIHYFSERTGEKNNIINSEQCFAINL